MANIEIQAYPPNSRGPGIDQATLRGLRPAIVMLYTASGLFVASHFLAAQLFPDRAGILSLGFQVMAPLLAAATCLYRGREGYSAGWYALALALIFWAAGLSINMIELMGFDNPEPGPSVSVLLSVLYGVPILFTTASPIDERASVRGIDAVLALALGTLFFIHSFSFSSIAATSSGDVFHLLLAFDVENLLIALFALLRFASSRDQDERTFFGTLSAYAFVYMLAAGYLNHVQHDTDYGASVDLMIDVPFLVLMIMAASRNQSMPLAIHLSVRQERFILAASPLMLPAMLLAVSAIVFRADPGWAIAGIATATLVSGLRNVLTHMHNLEERDRLGRLSRIDPLTGLPNRRCFDETFGREWSRAQRSGTSLAVLMIDIDHFKAFNDGLGHAEGDRCLREVAAALESCAMRGSDLVARYGGEEFVAILPAADPDQTTQFAAKMRESVGALGISSTAPRGRVTISIGIGHAVSVNEHDPGALMKAADDALYAAKGDGRDTCRIRCL